MNSGNLTSVITQNVKPVIEREGFELYHLEYVKENNEFYLRIYIDCDNGVTINDCVDISKTLCEEYFNTEDPIKEAYHLEVSSPGIERILHTEEHLNKYVENQVRVDLNKLHQGRKKMIGMLKDNKEDEIVVEGEELWNIPKEKIKRIKLKGEF